MRGHLIENRLGILVRLAGQSSIILDSEELEQRGSQVGLGLLLAPVVHNVGPSGTGFVSDLRADADTHAIETVTQTHIKCRNDRAVVAHNILGDLGLVEKHGL